MFDNRIEAGRLLAQRLVHLRPDDVVVLGLPRGGVPVASQVARWLEAPLDVLVVRKLGVPGQPELAMGALGEGGARVLNRDVVRALSISDNEISAVEQAERRELERRASLFRAGRARVPLAGRTVIVVDDGIATGATARAACEIVRAEGASRVILAVPVAPRDWTSRLAGVADQFVALDTPRRFNAVGQHYWDFSQTTDDDVIECLGRHPTQPWTPNLGPQDSGACPVDEEVVLEVGGAEVGGHLG